MKGKPNLKIFDFFFGSFQNVFCQALGARIFVFSLYPFKNRVQNESEACCLPQSFQFLDLPCQINERTKTFSDQAYSWIVLLEETANLLPAPINDGANFHKLSDDVLLRYVRDWIDIRPEPLFSRHQWGFRNHFGEKLIR